MISMTLADMAQVMAGKLILSDADNTQTLVCGAVTTDSREIVPGGIFFAKLGEFTDGHNFIAKAEEFGALVMVVDHQVNTAVTQIIVEDTVIALGELAKEVVARVRALNKLKIVGITGSNGKTTTKNLVRTIVEGIAPTVAARASYNNEVGAPTTMLELDESTEFLVAEMGASGVGEIERLVNLARPDVAVVLSVGLAHAGEFGGIEATLQTKTEMVKDLLSSDTAILNIDDPRVVSMAAKTKAKILWFGRNPKADIRATDIVSNRAGTEFLLHLPDGKSSMVKFAVLGEHHVMNALAATAVAHSLGVSIGQIVSSLESVQRAERWRMEIVASERGITIINDAYNASPDSVAAALKTMAQLSTVSGRTIAVLGEMSELGEFSGEEHDRISLLAVRLGIDQLVVVGDAARRMYISAVNEGSWDGESLFFSTSDAAYDYLVSELRVGDNVLVKSSNSAGLRFLGDRLGEVFA